jgi:hypothetical protein
VAAIMRGMATVYEVVILTFLGAVHWRNVSDWSEQRSKTAPAESGPPETSRTVTT